MMEKVAELKQATPAAAMKSVPAAQRSTYEIVRYIMVGGFNTVFGYGCFALFNVLLQRLGPHAYLLASLLANFVSISVAFLGYKWFVFRTHGNYLKEWLRCFAVYSTGVVVTLAGLPIVVTLLLHRGFGVHAPYIAAAVMALVTVSMSYLGHKHVSFRKQPAQKADV